MQHVYRITRFLEWTSSPLAQFWAAQLFFSPRRRYRKGPNFPALKRHTLLHMTRSGKHRRIQVYSAGTGPAILLVHGWEGGAMSFEALAQHLVAAGYRVLCFDGPAHGESQGRKTNLQELTDLVIELSQFSGPFKMMVGHSFGAVVAANAIDQGLVTRGLVTVGAPITTDFILNQFQKMVGTSDQTREFLGKKIEAIVEKPRDQVSLKCLVSTLSLPGLIIHDVEDQVIPVSSAEKLAQVWPQARFIQTEGLGHSRVLRDGQVGRKIIEFADQLI